MPTQRPTARQSQVLEFVKEYIQLWGCSPTFQEIGDKCGITVGTVHEHLNALEKRGIVTRNHAERRSIEVL